MEENFVQQEKSYFLLDLFFKNRHVLVGQEKRRKRTFLDIYLRTLNEYIGDYKVLLYILSIIFLHTFYYKKFDLLRLISVLNLCAF